jgi:hypothetical protein
MRIDSSGNVNIGTTGIAEKLVVNGAILSRSGQSALFSNTMSMDFNAGGLGRIIATGPDASTYLPIVFASTTTTTYAERMRIDASGNLLVGTTTANGRITAVSPDNTASTKIASFYANNLSQGIYIGYDGIATTASGQPMRFTVGSTAEAMRITNTGNVGIGTSSPGSNLQVNSVDAMGTGSATADILTVTNNNAVLSGVAGDKLGIVMSAMSNLSDRRVGLYCVAGNVSFNNPDFALFQSGQGIAFRETLRVTADNTATLRFNSGYGSVAAAYGCRAWVSFNSDGSIRASGNISSVSVNSSSSFNVNLTNAMPDTNYALQWTVNQETNHFAIINSTSQVNCRSGGSFSIGYLAIFR